MHPILFLAFASVSAVSFVGFFPSCDIYPADPSTGKVCTAWEHSSDEHSSAQKQQQAECSIGWEGAAMEKVKKKSGQVEGAQRGHQEEQKPWGGILRLC